MTARRRPRGDPPPATPPTFAQLYRDAVWEATPEQLTTAEALVLLAYANHAKGTDRAWVAGRRLMQQCKIGSDHTVARLRAALVDKGWLRAVGTVAVRGGRVTLYQLTTPERAAPSAAHWDSESAALGAPGATESAALEDRKRCTTAPKALHSGPESAALVTPNSLYSQDSPESKAGVAASRPAAPPATPNSGGVPPAAETIAKLREQLGGRRRAPTGHWKAGTAPAGEPNPDYDPATAAQAAASANDAAEPSSLPGDADWPPPDLTAAGQQHPSANGGRDTA